MGIAYYSLTMISHRKQCKCYFYCFYTDCMQCSYFNIYNPFLIIKWAFSLTNTMTGLVLAISIGITTECSAITQCSQHRPGQSGSQSVDFRWYDHITYHQLSNLYTIKNKIRLCVQLGGWNCILLADGGSTMLESYWSIFGNSNQIKTSLVHYTLSASVSLNLSNLGMTKEFTA